MGKTAFLFPGQGAQTVGMAAELCNEFAPARERFDQAKEILGYDLLDICTNGPAEQLDSTAHSQPAIYVASLAALERLDAEQPNVVDACVVTAGLSLGEYTALAFAGALSFADGLRVVAERGAAMQDASEATPSGMVSILGMELADIEAIVEEAAQGDVLAVANHLCPNNIVVSGTIAACERVAALADEKGAMRVVPLAVAGAFHTELMRSAVARLEAVLDTVDLRPPRIPVISNVDGQPHDDPVEIRRLLGEQVVNPVRWEDSMNLLLNDYGVETCYEIGPGRVLKGLMKRINRKMPCENVTA
ncbi:ACP S-malonyltransferase [Aeoliella mucimassa]|uniref:Malonyl CoA-acyl carrier protein transacylase n=1 Tax=Aeoliella mucimassa TaxID=2527972 RepID=A0A518AIU9_9BACT|nr:ACP S-malonyltransferase [Aeoliella mucimassa]QDU54662.1 Malonyl CoA-acyl carrier protein transacylase [Aeoliella mucimassa]